MIELATFDHVLMKGKNNLTTILHDHLYLEIIRYTPSHTPAIHTSYIFSTFQTLHHCKGTISGTPVIPICYCLPIALPWTVGVVTLS
jgi:hypothetical protein